MQGIKIADWGEEPSDVENASGFPLYHCVDLVWSKPTPVAEITAPTYL